LELAPFYGSDRPPLFPKQRVARAIAERTIAADASRSATADEREFMRG
jgi:hypothetical protein